MFVCLLLLTYNEKTIPFSSSLVHLLSMRSYDIWNVHEKDEYFFLKIRLPCSYHFFFRSILNTDNIFRQIYNYFRTCSWTCSRIWKSACFFCSSFSDSSFCDWLSILKIQDLEKRSTIFTFEKKKMHQIFFSCLKNMFQFYLVMIKNNVWLSYSFQYIDLLNHTVYKLSLTCFFLSVRRNTSTMSHHIYSILRYHSRSTNRWNIVEEKWLHSSIPQGWTCHLPHHFSLQICSLLTGNKLSDDILQIKALNHCMVCLN